LQVELAAEVARGWTRNLDFEDQECNGDGEDAV